jgi:tetratricopeptide (TPR) repeat protein
VELLPDLAPPTPVDDADSEVLEGSAESEVRSGDARRETPVLDVGAERPGAEPSVAGRDEGPEAGQATRSGRNQPAAPRGQPAAGQPPTVPEGRRESVSRAPAAAASTPRPQGNQLARARELVEAGRIEDAIAQYRLVLAENPDNLKAHNNLGVLFDELGQRGTAVEHFEEALRVEPENVEVLTNYGSALTSLQRFDAADAVLRRALRVAPDELSAHLALGILLFRRGLYTQAEAELRGVCDRDGANGAAFYYRAEALNRVGRFDEATEVMLRAAELLPVDPRPFYTLGHLYDRQQRPAEAAEMYRQARDLQGS